MTLDDGWLEGVMAEDPPMTVPPLSGPWLKEVSDFIQRYEESVDRMVDDMRDWYFRQRARGWFRCSSSPPSKTS